MAHIHNSQHNQKKIVRVQTNTVVFYGHLELSGEEKSKFEFEEKKFSIVLKMEVCGLKTQQISIFSTILNFFSSNSNFDFSSPDNSGDPRRLLYQFEPEHFFLVVLGVVDMCHDLLNTSNKVIWPEKKIMDGLKSAILAISQDFIFGNGI